MKTVKCPSERHTFLSIHPRNCRRNSVCLLSNIDFWSWHSIHDSRWNFQQERESRKQQYFSENLFLISLSSARPHIDSLASKKKPIPKETNTLFYYFVRSDPQHAHVRIFFLIQLKIFKGIQRRRIEFGHWHWQECLRSVNVVRQLTERLEFGINFISKDKK